MKIKIIFKTIKTDLSFLIKLIIIIVFVFFILSMGWTEGVNRPEVQLKTFIEIDYTFKHPEKLVVYACLSVCAHLLMSVYSVCQLQLVSYLNQWAGFDEILYLAVLNKYLQSLFHYF